MSHRAAASANWAPISIPTMRHILDRMAPPGLLNDDDLRSFTQLFLAPSRGILHFATQRRDFGEIAAVLMTVSSLRVRRGFASTSGTTHVVFVLSGSLTLRRSGDEPIELGIGEICSIGDWSKFEGECSEGTRVLHLMIPEARLRARGIRQPDLRFLLGGSGSLGTPLRNFALSVSDPSWHPSEVGSLIAEHTIEDLLVGMFLEHESLSADHTEEQEELVARALAVIAKSSRAHELRPVVVASRLTVSLRHLQRAFEANGITLAHSISQARVRTATLLLSSPSAHYLTMAQVADRSGFSSTFELRSAFRAEYGKLPSDFRDSGRAKVVPEDAQSHATASRRA